VVVVDGTTIGGEMTVNAAMMTIIALATMMTIIVLATITTIVIDTIAGIVITTCTIVGTRIV
jgi:hypothetical protein